MKKLQFYAVELDGLYKTEITATFSNFYNAKLYKERKYAERVAEKYDGVVVPVSVKEVSHDE